MRGKLWKASRRTDEPLAHARQRPKGCPSTDRRAWAALFLEEIMTKKKSQPKPLDPLEEMVRKQLDLEDAVARVALEDSQRSTLAARIAARLAKAHAAIKADVAPSDPLAGVPEADSGEALVNRWCVVWTHSRAAYPELRRIDSFDNSEGDGLPYEAQGDWFRSASPIERGIPEAIRKAVEG